MTTETRARPIVEETRSTGEADSDSGVVIGLLLGVASDGAPLVAYPGGAEEPARARSTVSLKPSDIGCQVALLFENGEAGKPLVIGKIRVPGREESAAGNLVTAKLDQEVLTLSAEREIVLRCGRASITLTRAGKIILRGAYVLSRSSGVNKIKGASVQIN
jgi:hypothetical protein